MAILPGRSAPAQHTLVPTKRRGHARRRARAVEHERPGVKSQYKRRPIHRA
ncbi:MAG: hypothetical protein LC754_09525 [Acidobacteria bacterium]|nr:hypothetical protein [Acidobacteriota bacterium]